MAVLHRLFLGDFCIFSGGRCGYVEWIEPESGSVYIQFDVTGANRAIPFGIDSDSIIQVIERAEAEAARKELIWLLRAEGTSPPAIQRIRAIKANWPVRPSFRFDDELALDIGRKATADLESGSGLIRVISLCLFGLETPPWEAR